jgi:alkaline phosphatase D
MSSGGDGSQNRPDAAAVSVENPLVKFYNTEKGHVRCDITKDRWQSDYLVIPYVSRKGSPQVTRASFVVEQGKPGIERV